MPETSASTQKAHDWKPENFMVFSFTLNGSFYTGSPNGIRSSIPHTVMCNLDQSLGLRERNRTADPLLLSANGSHVRISVAVVFRPHRCNDGPIHVFVNRQCPPTFALEVRAPGVNPRARPDQAIKRAMISKTVSAHGNAVGP